MTTVVLLGVGAYVLVQYVGDGRPGPPRCEVGGGDGTETYELSPAQARHAATISAVASARKLPERALTVALATALQESMLRNLDYGDRDSLGLFQQRPSQGWGTKRQVRDPVYASGKFYDHLVEIPGYADLPVTEAAQQVQRSGHPEAYAKHEPHARTLAAAFRGSRPASVRCTIGKGSEEVRTPGDPDRVRAELAREFGPGVVPRKGTERTSGGGPGQRNKGSARTSAEERTVVLSAPDRRRGWELAHWAVAHATSLGMEQIAYDGRVWSAEKGDEGWRTGGGTGRSEVRLSLNPR